MRQLLMFIDVLLVSPLRSTHRSAGRCVLQGSTASDCTRGSVRRASGLVQTGLWEPADKFSAKRRVLWNLREQPSRMLPQSAGPALQRVANLLVPGAF